MLPGIIALALQLAQPDPFQPAADPYCFAQAAQAYAVNADILRAIAWRESRFSTWKVHRNSDGTSDYGLMQINSRNLPLLHLNPHTAMDPCANVFGAARLLHRATARFGNTWLAIGAYHSTTPPLQQRYADDIRLSYGMLLHLRTALFAIRTAIWGGPPAAGWPPALGATSH